MCFCFLERHWGRKRYLGRPHRRRGEKPARSHGDQQIQTDSSPAKMCSHHFGKTAAQMVQAP